MIQFKDFKKEYGEYKALDIPFLEIDNGIYWLKGTNGSGKSTLLKSLAGLIPFEGMVQIDNINIRKNKQLHRRIVNYGEAEPVYPDFLTGQELIDFYIATKGGNKKICRQQAALLQLSDALHKKTGAYSSGMLKKLSLLLAFIGQPRWILLDEPLITLDAAAVKVVVQLIEQYYAQKIFFLLTSHQDVIFPHDSLPVQTLWIKDKDRKSVV